MPLPAANRKRPENTCLLTRICPGSRSLVAYWQGKFCVSVCFVGNEKANQFSILLIASKRNKGCYLNIAMRIQLVLSFYYEVCLLQSIKHDLTLF